MGQAAGARMAAEEFGFNPLTLLGVSTPIAPANAGQSGIGASIADAAMILGQGLINNTDKQRLAGLESTVAKQAKKLNDYQLRPRVPGPIQTRVASVTAGPAMAPAYSRNPAVALRPRRVRKNSYLWVNDPEEATARPSVKVFNTQANKWVTIDKGVADRIGIPPGGTIMAEDYEAIHGDVGAEFINLPNLANEAIGMGVTYPQDKKPASKTSKKKPLRKGVYPRITCVRGLK